MPHILVIDDDASVCRAVEEILTGSGYVVTIAGDGGSGIAVATKQPFAAAIVDLCTPSMNGLDTICAFRRLALDMPLVAMSSQIANCPATRPISSDVGESAGRLPAGQAVQA